MGSLSDAVLGVISIGLGLLIALWGYRIFKAYLWISAFFIGAISTAIALTDAADFSIVNVLVSSLVAGVISAVLILLFYYIGLILIGVIAGIVIVSVPIDYFSPDENITAALLVIGVIFGAISIVRFERPILIILTSLSGAGSVISGIIYIFALDRDVIEQFIEAADGTPLEALVLVLLGLAVAAVGARNQFLFEDDDY